MRERRTQAAILFVVGAALVVAARSFDWELVENYDYGSPSGWYDVALVTGAVLVALLGLAGGIRSRPAVESVAELAATLVAGMLLAGVVIYSEFAETPSTGAWLAGGAISVLGAAIVRSRDPHPRWQTVWCVAITIAAFATIALSPGQTIATHPEITVIK